MQKSRITNVGQTGAVRISKSSDGVSFEVRPSCKGAIKGASTGIVIGRFFGPAGMVTGAIIGGTLGYVLGSDSD